MDGGHGKKIKHISYSGSLQISIIGSKISTKVQVIPLSPGIGIGPKWPNRYSKTLKKFGNDINKH